MTGRLRTFFELGDEHAIQLGLSGASGQTADRLRQHAGRRSTSSTSYRPDGWLPSAADGRRPRRSTRSAASSVDDLDGDGADRREDHAQPLRLVRLRRGAAVAALGVRRALRLVAVPRRTRAASGRSSRTSRSGRRSSCASGWPTSTPTARSAMRPPATAAARGIVDEIFFQAHVHPRRPSGASVLREEPTA